jgi:hypothetical protein
MREIRVVLILTRSATIAAMTDMNLIPKCYEYAIEVG